jgi:hypothetical protein
VNRNFVEQTQWTRYNPRTSNLDEAIENYIATAPQFKEELPLYLADCPLELDAEGRMLNPRKTISSIQVVGANYVHEGVKCRP